MGDRPLDDIEQLYMENYQRMSSFANAVLHDPDQTEDAVQDTFMEAIRKYEDTLQHHPNKTGWLMLTLKRKIQERQRAAQREKQRTATLGDQEIPDNSMDMAQRISMQNFNLQNIRKLLSAEEFIILTRFSLDGKSYAAISKELGISPANCAKRMERIRKKIKSHFSDLFQD